MPRGQKKKQYSWKKQIKIEQNYICPVCGLKGTDRSMDIHHCLPVSAGGLTTRENCVAVHRTCHQWIHEEYGNEYYDPRKSRSPKEGV